MKKIFLTILIFTLLGFTSAFAAQTESGWEYTSDGNAITITGYKGNGGVEVIPEEIEGLPVTKITGNQLLEKSSVTSLTLPSTLRYMDKKVFLKTQSLEELIIKDGLETISEYAFAVCENLKSVTLPQTLHIIENGAFSNCKSLESINFPDTLTSIGSGAFREIGIEELDLSNCSTLIGEMAFCYCENLKTVTIGRGTTEIPDWAFGCCNKLREVNLPDTITCIYGAFVDCDSLEHIVLPTSLKKIKGAVHSTNLFELTIPYGVEEMTLDTLNQCHNLEAVYVPDTVTFIGISDAYESEEMVIYCTANSDAARICREKGLQFRIDNSVNSPVTIYYNRKRISFHEYGVNPVITEGHTLVPLRSVFEAMGASVEWDSATQTVSAKRRGTEVTLTIGESAIYKNDTAIPIDAPARIMSERTMIPLRAIAEAFGADVEWNQNGCAVLISDEL